MPMMATTLDEEKIAGEEILTPDENHKLDDAVPLRCKTDSK